MRRTMILGFMIGAAAVAASAERPAVPACVTSGEVRQVPELVEGSGIAASLRTPGRFWAHNDSGDPVLFALDDTGEVTGRVQLAGARVEDWEAVAVGACGAGSCIYVGDIGDNDASRQRITVYRVDEPAQASGTVRAEALHATYPDGPHDAEALIVDRDGRLVIVTKGETGPVSLYRFPASPEAGGVARLERIGDPRGGGRAAKGQRITDAAISPDGQWVALRTTATLSLHRAAELLAGKWSEITRVELAPLKEPQGEGVTFAGAETVYLVGEGGGKARPGTFARLACSAAR